MAPRKSVATTCINGAGKMLAGSWLLRGKGRGREDARREDARREDARA